MPRLIGKNFCKKGDIIPSAAAPAKCVLKRRDFSATSCSRLCLLEKKLHFFSSYASYIIDNEDLPASGEKYVVLDRSGSPRCIIELTSVRIVPFCEVTREMVIAEGEDESLEAWREKEKGYLEDEGEIVGFAFAEDIKLVFHEFRIVD